MRAQDARDFWIYWITTEKARDNVGPAYQHPPCVTTSALDPASVTSRHPARNRCLSLLTIIKDQRGWGYEIGSVKMIAD